jgi:hypothetical protein
MVRASILIAILMIATIPRWVAANPLTQCSVGQSVVDDHGNSGQIAGEHDEICLVRSPDGRVQSWVPMSELSLAQPVPPAAPSEAAQPKRPGISAG